MLPSITKLVGELVWPSTVAVWHQAGKQMMLVWFLFSSSTLEVEVHDTVFFVTLFLGLAHVAACLDASHSGGDSLVLSMHNIVLLPQGLLRSVCQYLSLWHTVSATT